MSYNDIIVETHGKVGLIRLHRPRAHNALSHRLVSELGRALAAFDADPAIGCLVLTGDDEAFCAGADIKAIQEIDFVAGYGGDLLRDWSCLAECRKPVIAAVGGAALGGGCELAMMCDVIIAADNARFALPEITLGTVPGMGGTQRLPRAVGKSKAMEMCLTARAMTADEAERAGLVSRVVPVAGLLDDALATAARIASFSLPVVLMIKEAVGRAFETSLQEGLRFERNALYASFGLADKQEGMAAFVEKRPPVFLNK